jgi:O-antigen/teichoic acid export membrane protein
MSRFLRNVSSNYAVAAVHAALLLAVTPFVVDRLGASHYAVWIIVQTIGYFLGFLDLGLADAQVRQHARLAARGASRDLPRLHGTVLTVLAGAGLVAILLAAGIALLPSAALLDIPGTARDHYAALLLLVGVAAAAAMLDTGFDGIFEGHQRYDLMNLVNLATDAARRGPGRDAAVARPRAAGARGCARRDDAPGRGRQGL